MELPERHMECDSGAKPLSTIIPQDHREICSHITIVSTTSAITAATLYFSTSGTRGLVEADRSGLGWFFFSGFLNFLSYLTMFIAFNLERVSVVTPLASCSSLFTPMFSYFLLREVDPITPRKVTATVLGVLGVFLIAWEKM